MAIATTTTTVAAVAVECFSRRKRGRRTLTAVIAFRRARTSAFGVYGCHRDASTRLTSPRSMDVCKRNKRFIFACLLAKVCILYRTFSFYSFGNLRRLWLRLHITMLHISLHDTSSRCRSGSTVRAHQGFGYRHHFRCSC